MSSNKVVESVSWVVDEPVQYFGNQETGAYYKSVESENWYELRPDGCVFEVAGESRNYRGKVCCR
ncbi:hypothetical protein [Fictibacillus sp. NRS-1165]|uniref:hypothetical protein n=1 Tax=Fictibacillus sp. NRS-1165 TaxID=3144463 RepID=UPI003D1A4115